MRTARRRHPPAREGSLAYYRHQVRGMNSTDIGTEVWEFHRADVEGRYVAPAFRKAVVEEYNRRVKKGQMGRMMMRP